MEKTNRLFSLRTPAESGWACEFVFKDNENNYRSFLLSDSELMSFAEQVAKIVKERGLI
jgi:hypothetical protein